MAPTIQIDYRGQRESNKLSKVGLGDRMGKTRKVSKGHSTGFVPDYRHAVETMAETEGLGSSGRDHANLDASESYSALKRKCKSLNVDGNDRFGVPMRFLPLSKMSHLERRDLEVRLKNELEQIRMFQRKIASFSLDPMVQPPATDTHSYQNGSRTSVMESLPVSKNDVAQGKKKGHVGKKGPRTKGGAVVARRTESMKQDPPQDTSLVMLMKQCETLLTRMMAHQDAWIFNEPVDVVKHNIPDYFNVIKHPMDLGTVKRKLLLGQYSSPMGFAADVRLTFQNAMTYNPAGHDVYVMAQVLSKYFEMRWKPIEKKIPHIATEAIDSKSNVYIEPEIAYIPPSKKQKTNSVENKVKKEADKRVMSSLEKQRLSEELEASLAELPENIINFLKESTLNESQVSEDEIEIDIDTLSDDTLFMLRKLLDDHLLEKRESQTTVKPCQIEIHNESGFSNLSSQPRKENEAPDEDVDIDGDDPPPFSSSTPMEVDTSAAQRNGNCSSSSSESGSTSSDTDSESSSAGELDGAKSTVPGSTLNESVDSRAEHKENDIGDANTGGQTLADFSNDRADQSSHSNSTSIGPDCHQQGESAPPNSQVSPGINYRAALLRSRFADIIIKAQENSTEKGERPDPEKMKHEREELERRRREEKARLQAEAKAAEAARKKAEEEAAAEAQRKREVEREEARLALQKMEKTVDIDENGQFMVDLEMLKAAAPDERLLQSFVEEASCSSPEFSQNGFGSFKFQANNNPLEQLGLYMKNDEEEEEEEIEPQSIFDASNDPEEGEID
ncbi:hypothetical protein RD792_008802 [Penstemon davidsonii]|uniref:Uncharacterized protein n=1 Tax=Penstemon davidsonii TaxID=160366 RepID=A0ABR0DAQ3_9LAMI|nr:hypothetical protein RD792_008802 [Penstemon davidsonii]